MTQGLSQPQKDLTRDTIATEVWQLLNRLCRHKTMYLCIALCSKPQLLDLVSSHKPVDQGWMWRQGQRLPERVREVSLFTEHCVNMCSPWSHPHSKLPDTQRVKGLYTCAPITCSADYLLHEPVEIGRQRSGLLHFVPDLYRRTDIPLTLSQNILVSQVPIMASAYLLTLMTTTLKSGLDKLSERKPDSAGREKKANMVTVSSYTLPLILQKLFANMRDNASSCSYWAMANALRLLMWAAMLRHNKALSLQNV